MAWADRGDSRQHGDHRCQESTVGRELSPKGSGDRKVQQLCLPTLPRIHSYHSCVCLDPHLLTLSPTQNLGNAGAPLSGGSTAQVLRSFGNTYT